jgi:altronate dehydratase large subunit
VALVDLQAGDKAIKYGEMIGEVSHPVAKGGWVNENNIFSVPRDYDSELV